MHTPAKVFISYSHDSIEHRNNILQIAQNLRKEGFNCSLDSYAKDLCTGWQTWMRDQIIKSDFVIMVFTLSYYNCFTKQKDCQGKGVSFESEIITQELYDSPGKNNKYIPTITDNGSPKNIPSKLRQYNYYSLPSQYENLYRHLSNQPLIKPEKIGKIKKLKTYTSIPNEEIDREKISKIAIQINSKKGLASLEKAQTRDIINSLNPENFHTFDKFKNIINTIRTLILIECYPGNPGAYSNAKNHENLKTARSY